LAGFIQNWRVGRGGDDLRAAPYFTKRDNSPVFNRLFAAIYDIFFTKMTNLRRLISTCCRTLKDIFTEKIHGTDKYLVSEHLIAYLKWLIYVAAFKDRSTLPHEDFYGDVLEMFKGSRQWRGRLYNELDAWSKDFQPSKRRRSHGASTSRENNVNRTRVLVDLDDFVDPLDPQAAAGADAPAAAAAAPAAAAAAGGQ
jgi:hypothetical protein